MGYWGAFDFAFAVLYFCLIQCFCHLVAEKGFEIRVLYETTLFGKKKIKMSTASKIFSKLDHIAGVGNGGY